MFKRIFLFISILFLLIFFAVIQSEPADLEVRGSVDKNKVALNETFNFKIDISADSKSTPDIKLSDLKKNFNVFSSGQSQRISLGGDQNSLGIRYEFILQPKEVGKFTIGEVEVKFKGKLYKTEPIEIEVMPAEKSESLPEQLEEEPSSSEGIFI